MASVNEGDVTSHQGQRLDERHLRLRGLTLVFDAFNGSRRLSERMIHAIILLMAADGKAALDQRSRRWICEACRGHALTVPEIAESLRARGWRGAPGALATTVKKLAQDGYLREVGAIVQGKRKPSPQYTFVTARSKELEGAVLTNAGHHIDSGDELILIPVEYLSVAARILRAAGPEVLWGIRTGDSSVGLLVVVSRDADEANRDRLVTLLQAANARRVTGGLVLDRDRLIAYCSRLITEGPNAALPPVT